MHAADGLICKAGGLVVTDALASSLPMILVDVLPGQETGNAQYVVDAGSGDMGGTPMTVLETAAHWMADDAGLLKQRSENAGKIGLPLAAFAAAELAWQVAQAPLTPGKPKFRLRLAELAQRLEAEAQKLASGRKSDEPIVRISARLDPHRRSIFFSIKSKQLNLVSELS